jgi:ankyrin repeat protein
VQEALAQGAPPDLTDEAGFTPLHRACKHGHTAAVKELLATRKVDVDAQTKAGWTPMLLAAASGAVEVVRVLLQHAR